MFELTKQRHVTFDPEMVGSNLMRAPSKLVFPVLPKVISTTPDNLTDVSVIYFPISAVLAGNPAAVLLPGSEPVALYASVSYALTWLPSESASETFARVA